MEPKTKQSLLVTVVGVTLFVALLRLSDVLAFAAKLIDLVLPILAGGILALFINVPMTGLEKRLNRLFGKAKKQPSAKAIHLLSFFITLLGVVLVLVLALTLLIPELVQSFHSLYVQIEANIPRWTAYLNAQDADMGWLMNWLEGHQLGAAAAQGHRKHRHGAGQCGRGCLCHGEYRDHRLVCADHLRLYVP